MAFFNKKRRNEEGVREKQGKVDSPDRYQEGKRQNIYWATSWTIGVLRFDSRRGLGIFLFTTASRTALEPTQPPIQ
jgi:hypothetical protein